MIDSLLERNRLPDFLLRLGIRRLLAQRLREVIGEIDEATIGDLLVAVVELAREKDIESESVLRARMGKFRADIRQAEGLG